MVDQVGDLEVDRGSILDHCHNQLRVPRLLLRLFVNFIITFICVPPDVPIAAAVGELFQDQDDFLPESANILAVIVVIISLHLEFLFDLLIRFEKEVEGLNKLCGEGQDAHDLEAVGSHLLEGLNVGDVIV